MKPTPIKELVVFLQSGFWKCRAAPNDRNVSAKVAVDAILAQEGILAEGAPVAHAECTLCLFGRVRGTWHVTWVCTQRRSQGKRLPAEKWPRSAAPCEPSKQAQSKRGSEASLFGVPSEGLRRGGLKGKGRRGERRVERGLHHTFVSWRTGALRPSWRKGARREASRDLRGG